MPLLIMLMNQCCSTLNKSVPNHMDSFHNGGMAYYTSSS